MAAGSSGMATTFGDSSTQYSVLYNFDSTLEAGTEITLTDADGTEVMSYTPSKAFSSIVFSSDELAAGDYTVTAGDTTEKITLSGVSTTAGTASGMGQQMGLAGRVIQEIITALLLRMIIRIQNKVIRNIQMKRQPG